MVAHSIIIPHRDRQATLEVCLFSIEWSACICGVRDYEVLVVDNGSQTTEFTERLGKRYEHTRWISNLDTMVEFNKPRLQNTGIEKSRGDILTFLDADAVVNSWFMNERQRLRPEVSKLCYRVRLLPCEQLAVWQDSPDKTGVVAGWFDRYDQWWRAFEAYGQAHTDSQRGKEGNGTLFGNSHFSVRRDVLGEMRFCEHFPGHGYDDISFNWHFAKQLGDAYNPVLVDDAVLCLQHQYNDSRWLGGGIGRRNEDRYFDIIEGRRKYTGGNSWTKLRRT